MLAPRSMLSRGKPQTLTKITSAYSIIGKRRNEKQSLAQKRAMAHEAESLASGWPHFQAPEHALRGPAAGLRGGSQRGPSPWRTPPAAPGGKLQRNGRIEYETAPPQAILKQSSFISRSFISRTSCHLRFCSVTRRLSSLQENCVPSCRILRALSSLRLLLTASFL